MKSCIPSISQNRNVLFRRNPIFLLVIFLLLSTNYLKGQTEFISSYLIIPEKERNEITMAPGVVINHSMIEKFIAISFPSDNMGLSNLIMKYSLDSVKIVFESQMRKNIAKVSETESY